MARKESIVAGQFDNFTPRAKRVLELAQEEARSFNHNYLGTEHLLLGLVAESDGMAARVLLQLGVQPADVRAAIEYTIGRGVGEVAAGELKLVPRAKHVLELALAEAQQLGQNYIGTEHLLLGLLREGEGVGSGILAGLGVTVAQVHDRLDPIFTPARRSGVRERVEIAVGRMRGRRSASDPAETKGNVITCRITDQDLAAIDALVESGIRATRSDAAAWLIGAGIEARRDIFDKVFATIDQIRRLRAEAQAIAQRAGMGAASASEEKESETKEGEGAA